MTTQPSSGSPQTDPAKSSATRRRDILRRIGQGSVVAGTASPLAALATGSGQKHCHHKIKQQTVVASISGMNSVVLSAQTGVQSAGFLCLHYSNVSHVPTSCKTFDSSLNAMRCKTFAEIWIPSSRDDPDSKGAKWKTWQNGAYRLNPDCLLNKKINELCAESSDIDEKHWVTAYCNASSDHSRASELKFPYTCAEVKGFRGDAEKKQAAMEFFKTCMENKTA